MDIVDTLVTNAFFKKHTYIVSTRLNTLIFMFVRITKQPLINLALLYSSLHLAQNFMITYMIQYLFRS